MIAAAIAIAVFSVGMSLVGLEVGRRLGRSVEDKTGLTGNYDYTLDWTPDDATATAAQWADGGQPGAGSATSPATPGPSLFTAIEEQLGLKLEPRKGSVDIIVIDHIEQPSAN